LAQKRIASPDNTAKGENCAPFRETSRGCPPDAVPDIERPSTDTNTRDPGKFLDYNSMKLGFFESYNVHAIRGKMNFKKRIKLQQIL